MASQSAPQRLRLALTPDATGSADAATIVQADRVLTLPVPLAGISTDSVSHACEALLELAEQMAVDVGDEDLLDALMHKLTESAAPDLTFDTASAGGWAQLESALRTAIQAGINPSDLAQVINNLHREGGNSARGRNPSSI